MSDVQELVQGHHISLFRGDLSTLQSPHPNTDPKKTTHYYSQRKVCPHEAGDMRCPRMDKLHLRHGSGLTATGQLEVSPRDQLEKAYMAQAKRGCLVLPTGKLRLKNVQELSQGHRDSTTFLRLILEWWTPVEGSRSELMKDATHSHYLFIRFQWRQTAWNWLQFLLFIFCKPPTTFNQWAQ